MERTDGLVATHAPAAHRGSQTVARLREIAHNISGLGVEEGGWDYEHCHVTMRQLVADLIPEFMCGLSPGPAERRS